MDINFKNNILWIICVLFFLATAISSLADDKKDIPGRPAGSSMLSDIESINNFNGSVTVNVPFFSVGGRGDFSYNMYVTTQNLTSTTHHSVLENCVPDCQVYTYTNIKHSISGVRFLPFTLKVNRADQFDQFSPTGWWYAKTFTTITLEMAGGASHILYDVATNGKHFNGTYNPNPLPPITSGFLRGKVFKTTDGSDMTFVSDNDIRDSVPMGNDPNKYRLTGYLLMGNGTKFRIENLQIITATDRNGNLTTFNYEPPPNQYSMGRVNKITDSIGREIEITYSTPTGTNEEPPSHSYHSVTYKGSSGGTRTIKIYGSKMENALRPEIDGYPASTIKTFYQLFGSASYLINSVVNPNVITKIEFPDNTFYDFKYNSFAELALLTLPQGGSIAYEHGSGFGTNQGQFLQTGLYGTVGSYKINRRVKERRIRDSNDNIILLNKFDDHTHTITAPPNSNVQYKGHSSMELFLPNGTGHLSRVSKTKYFYNGSPVREGLLTYIPVYEHLLYNNWNEGKNYKTEFFDADGVTLLRTTENVWQQKNNTTFSWWSASQLPKIEEPANDPRLISTKVTQNDSNLTALTSFKYDNYNNLTDKFEYDYDGSFIRQTHIDYVTDSAYVGVNGAYLRSLPREQTVIGPITNSFSPTRPVEPPGFPWPLPSPSPFPQTPSSGQVYSRIKFEYDNYSSEVLLDRSNVVGHKTLDYGITNQTRGNITKTISYEDVGDENSLITSIQAYDILGNIVKTIDANGNASMIGFNDNFGVPDNEATANIAPPELLGLNTFAFPSSSTNPLGWTAFVQYDYYTGNAVNSQDINGLISKTIYNDPLERPTQAVDAVGTSHEIQTTTIYDAPNRRTQSTTDLNHFNDNLLKTENFYDEFGQTIESRTYKNAGFISVLTEYDGLGRVIQTSNPFRPHLNEALLWTKTKFDSLGRVIEIESPDGAKAQTIYSGKAVTSVDQAGKKKRSITNAIGQIIRVDEPDEAGELGSVPSPNQSTSYSYDSLGNLLTVNQGVQTRTFTYDSLSRLLTADNPESGLISYQYDANSNLASKIDARGVKTEFIYDALNRTTNRNYSLSGPPPANYQSTPNTIYTYKTIAPALGSLIKVESGNSVFENTEFDISGRVTKSSQSVDGITYGNGINDSEMTYTYNLSGVLIEQQYPSGRKVKNVLNISGDLSIVQSRRSVSSGFWSYAKSFTYNAAGVVTSSQLGNGKWESILFNSRLQPIQIALGSTQEATNFLKLEYSYGGIENNGNVLSQTITVPSIGITTGFIADQNYNYDSLNRIKSAEELISGIQSWKQDFTYDRYGNRLFNEPETTTLLKSCIEGGNPIVCTADRKIINPSVNILNNRLHSADGYSYDASGSTVQDPQGRTFIYDAEFKQVEVRDSLNNITGQYIYDGEGKRIKKIIPSSGETTVFVYDALGKLVAEYSVLNPTQPRPPSPETTYLTLDPLGSPRLLTDENGQIISRRDFHPFGEEIISSNRVSALGYQSDDVRQKFTGYERDKETNLDFAQARFFNSDFGRFSTPDDFHNDSFVSDPQSWNLYAYVRNNPLTFIDPTGMWTDFVSQQSGRRVHVPDGKDQVIFVNDSQLRNLPALFNDHREIYNRDLARLEKTNNLNITVADFNKLANAVYNESAPYSTGSITESQGIVNVLQNRARADNTPLMDQVSSAKGFRVNGVNKNHYFSETGIDADKKRMVTHRGIIRALRYPKSDVTNGAFFWDGVDFYQHARGNNSGWRERHQNGYFFTHSSHDLFNQGNHIARKGPAVGGYYYESTAAIGRTTFSRRYRYSGGNWR